MIKDAEHFHQFEKEVISGESPDFEKNLQIVEALYEEARLMKIFPPADPLDGIEHAITIAKAINSV